jgi:UDPglucose--hexose-1-phosphate uridylyltransferase
VYRDLFDTKIMSLLMSKPSEVITKFESLYQENPRKATDYYYNYSQDTDYIRRYRICKDMRWKSLTEYGELDITINLSKPEKDPVAIAAALHSKQSQYPKCLLCKENEGYAGNVMHPARQNLRIMPIKIQNQDWGFQYSPYVYYNEHCIVFNTEHTPMKIDRSVFYKLFDFVNIFPHYCVGSNADLPIVGGSILTHEHFQGGNYDFAMAKAPIEKTFALPGYPQVTAGIVKWPMSVIRLQSKTVEPLIELGSSILDKWRGYSDEAAFIFAYTDKDNQKVPHNTITPIARKVGELYELDLVLRNNITTEEHPLGVYHPHEELHHIKKENIGLIEVMGLAILPSRLKEEMEVLKACILEGKDMNANELTQKHAEWVSEFLPHYDKLNQENIDEIIEMEIGKVFLNVLEHAGVFKRDQNGQEAFMRFIQTL